MKIFTRGSVFGLFALGVQFNLVAEVDIDLDVRDRSVYYDSGCRKAEAALDKILNSGLSKKEQTEEIRSKYAIAAEKSAKINRDISGVRQEITFSHESFGSTQNLSDLTEERDFNACQLKVFGDHLRSGT